MSLTDVFVLSEVQVSAAVLHVSQLWEQFKDKLEYRLFCRGLRASDSEKCTNGLFCSLWLSVSAWLCACSADKFVFTGPVGKASHWECSACVKEARVILHSQINVNVISLLNSKFFLSLSGQRSVSSCRCESGRPTLLLLHWSELDQGYTQWSHKVTFIVINWMVMIVIDAGC